jgi:hypothetical protein
MEAKEIVISVVIIATASVDLDLESLRQSVHRQVAEQLGDGIIFDGGTVVFDRQITGVMEVTGKNED